MKDITVSFPGGKRVDAHYDGHTVKEHIVTPPEFDVVLVGSTAKCAQKGILWDKTYFNKESVPHEMRGGASSRLLWDFRD